MDCRQFRQLDVQTSFLRTRNDYIIIFNYVFSIIY